MELTRAERLALYNQYLILERLYADDADEYAKAREVVSSGYELNYDWIAERIYRQTVSADRCREVLDILEMFRTLERSYDQLDQKPDVKESDVRFHGFDGNSETDYLGYARFVMEKEGLYTDLAHGEGFGDNLNSHMPTLWRYIPMLREWQQIPTSQRYELDAEGIALIVAAGRSSNG